MTRGPKPTSAIRDAKKFAERMGYTWQENTDNPALAYDLIVFREVYTFLVQVRVVRNHINPDTFYADLLADDRSEVQALLFPKWMPREIWRRSQHERTFRRLRIYDVAVGEIGFF